ncbi:MAG: SDR family oxidoreductase [Phenylobacterium sp.]|uniref:SDR family NAD(P)-dependent oxidoreductase n=1 Tax=Phenylobacterium sp. TaxID=1871053 RepID=UPI0012020B18|nr:SDR family NAD(P)-dependent oxidoreductase [Phenylobacterium sp.]TAJ73515.1 MAG: SDR family oxidoreductase [Phenylobacterium sp.]
MADADKPHAVVTGGGSGIGLAIARELSAMDFAVTLMGRDPDRLARASTELPNAQLVPCDVTDPERVGAAFAEAVSGAGPVSVLVNNAGIVRTAPFARQSDADWDAMWRTNVLGAVHCTRQVLAPMRDLAAGRIVSIASTASLKGYGYVSAYVASKHALLGLTRALAVELAQTNITVNAICPGYADTDIIRDAVETIAERTGRTEADARTSFTSSNPQGRLIDPMEVAGTVAWLVSHDARSVTGQAIVVAGGEVM